MDRSTVFIGIAIVFAVLTIVTGNPDAQAQYPDGNGRYADGKGNYSDANGRYSDGKGQYADANVILYPFYCYFHFGTIPTGLSGVTVRGSMAPIHHRRGTFLPELNSLLKGKVPFGRGF